MKKRICFLCVLMLLGMFASAESNLQITKDETSNLYGITTGDGTVLFEPQFEYAEFLTDDTIIVRTEEDLHGIVDATGTYLLQPSLDYIGRYNKECDVVIARNDTMYGLINPRGETVLPFEFNYISLMEDGSYLASTDDGNYYYTISDGQAIPLTSIASSFSLERYYPNSGKDVVSLDEEPTLLFRSDYPLPRIDGATALFPTYSAIVQMLYPEDTVYEEYSEPNDEILITCTKTNTAYDRLISGECDVIFCAGPSDAQVSDAAAQGVEFKLTPFGSEAFVFFVNQNNPLNDISLDQIRGIYSGKIKNWSKLGVDGIGEIVAYQRPANSGSQTALERLMGDTPIADPPFETEISHTMDMIINVIEYRNYPNAIGYSFRFFLSVMMESDVKMLSIEGIAPTEENIRAGKYPISSTLYAVTRKNETNPNVAALLAWLQSDQGARLIQASGYTPTY